LKQSETPAPLLRVCMNCMHRAWGVALGVGVRCKHAANMNDGKLFVIPCRNHSCEHFSEKRSSERPDSRSDRPLEPGSIQ
jgi:hypothetical protein